MANIDNPNGFEWVKSLFGDHSPVILKGVLKTGETIAVGDALTTDTDGLITIATSSSGQILGVANEAVTSSAAGAEIEFIPALPHYVFSGQTSGTAAQTDIWENLDIEGTTGIMELNEDANTEEVARPIGLSTLRQGTSSNAFGANARLDFIWVRSAFTGGLPALT